MRGLMRAASGWNSLREKSRDRLLTPTSLSLVVHGHAFRWGELEFIGADRTILLAFQGIATALPVLFNGAELVNGSVLRHIDGELFQVAIGRFRRQREIVTFLCHMILFPVTGLIAGDKHKRRVAGGIFQQTGANLLNERVVEPQGFTIRDEDAFIRCGHVPVEQVRALHPHFTFAVLHRCSATVCDFLIERSVEAFYFVQTLLQIARSISPRAGSSKSRQQTAGND
ncbi:hypothetical protein EPYR_02466 [Erwinia pyrifoliae DSM 12163]|nr:hypothetical protein EPYR_02466 [Erwinia pyrifoliae DSM 12163]